MGYVNRKCFDNSKSFAVIVTSIPKSQISKNRKIFSAHNEQGSMKRGEKWFPEKLWKYFDWENFWSESSSIHTCNYKGKAPASEFVLIRWSLPSEIALQGGSLKSKIVYRGVGAYFEKPKKYFPLTTNKVALAWNVEKSGFQKTYENILT